MLQIEQDACVQPIHMEAAGIATAGMNSAAVEPGAAKNGAAGATPCEELDEGDFCDMLLAALVAMAVKSKRRQADISAVMARSQLNATPQRLWTALQTLLAASRVRDVVPLYDGGMLVTVTNTGMDLLGASRSWSFLQDVDVAAA